MQTIFQLSPTTEWLPEVFLGVAGILCLILPAFGLRSGWTSALAGFGVFSALIATVLHSQYLAESPDPLQTFSCELVLAMGALLFLSSGGVKTNFAGERIGTLLLAVLGATLAVRAEDLILLFIGLELLSLATYVLLYLDEDGPERREGATKYFYLSILASAVFLFGVSFLYGLGGSLNLQALVIAGSEGSFSNFLATIPLVFILCGLGFKIAAVPFHFYAPDVYQATSHRNAALLSALPKIVGFVVLMKIILGMTLRAAPQSWQIVLAISALTMTVGNVLALWQYHIRRLLAYSSIAHAGYMLIGLTVAMTYAQPGRHPWDGKAALLLYLVVYVLATVGAFAALGTLRVQGRNVETLDDLRGLARSPAFDCRIIAWAMAAFMFSLAGIPPLAGFWGKLAVFFSALDIGGSPSLGPAKTRLIVLAVVGAINTAIGAAYYLRVVATLFCAPEEDKPLAELQRAPAGGLLTMGVCLALTIVIGVAPGQWIQRAYSAGSSLRTSTTAMPSTSFFPVVNPLALVETDVSGTEHRHPTVAAQ
ncbi:MAG: NADH-quinone oxidoreductase subunit N [Thermogutta sp.]